MRKFLPPFFSIIIVLVVVWIATNTAERNPSLPAAGGLETATPVVASVSGQEKRLKNLKTWACQLQGLEKKGAVAKLAASRYGMVVVEPTCTERGSKGFDTKRMVSRIKKSGKLVLAYVNIAEAENWRQYWTWSLTNRAKWPAYLINGDPDGWVGDYPVAYWDQAWQDLLFSKIVDETLRDGFDGIYMDWVGGYDEEIVLARAKQDRVDAHEQMVALLSQIRQYTRSKDPDFLMIQQNAVGLHEGYPSAVDAIDGIAEEAVWYDGTAFDDWNDKNAMDIKTPPADTKYYIQNLSVYQTAGKPVFALEYAVKYKKKAMRLAAQHGYIAYCARRALSQLS
ncbi:MAG: endo alpha-1,4 polygalactosaminidase [Clostridia bacterium]